MNTSEQHIEELHEEIGKLRSQLQQARQEHAEAVAAFHDATRLRSEIQREREKAEDRLEVVSAALKEASTLLHLMWCQLESHFSHRALSRCLSEIRLSEIAERIFKITGKKP